MRYICSACTLIAALVFMPLPVIGFEIENQQTFPGVGGNAVLRIISTADIEVFEPIILEFQETNPGITVDYTIAGSSDLMKAIYVEGGDFDLAISSAMDLQTKLANDGFAQTYRSAATDALPEWAKWRNQIFAFTQEPAVLVASDAAFAGLDEPSDREELITLLRDNQDRFRGRIGTYDVRISGLGYLFATQDSRNSESFWRLTEMMGRLDTRLYCCSGDMISDVASGEILIAYNVLGSYAASDLTNSDELHIVALDDFLSVMLRSVLIPVSAKNIGPAHSMIDFLVTLNSRPDLAQKSGLPPIDDIALRKNNALRPIRLGPGLLVFLDRIKKNNFVRSWASSIEQE